jgi:CheY-like chemotaxis protein
MTGEVLAKAFEPFFTTKPVGKGSGLGLSQVFGLAKQSGGGVRIETRPGKGTAVKVFLPRADGFATAAVLQNPDSVPRPAGRPLVLLVDDDEPVREVTAGLLAELGYAVLEADSGADALKVLEGSTDVAAMITDYAMPGMNGGELARSVQARRPDLPVLFASGYADVAALTQAGEDRVVHKPFVQRELAAKLAAALGG